MTKSEAMTLARALLDQQPMMPSDVDPAKFVEVSANVFNDRMEWVRCVRAVGTTLKELGISGFSLKAWYEKTGSYELWGEL